MKKKRFWIISSISILLLILMVECKVHNTEKYYAKAKQNYAPFDAIIVPGVPFEGEKWSNIMMLRMYWAKMLWDQGMTKNIIFSGGAVYTKYAECKVMRLYALEMGIPDEHIFLDSLAEHSTENVYYSYYLAKHHNLHKIAIATDPYQTKMVKKFVKKMNKKLNADIQFLPAIMDSVIAVPKEEFTIDGEKAIGENFINITETQSMWYRINGTFGNNVDWDNPPVYK